MHSLSRNEVKKAVGYRAADLIEHGMRVGLGSGSTSHFFIERLIQRCHQGLRIHAMASSRASHELAKQGGIPLLDASKVTSLDITIDGADEIDPQKRMIKGGGGAHVREKIMANMSQEMIVIIDESKCVPTLGTRKLPVEIIPFCLSATIHHIEKAGYRGSLRKTQDESLIITDNGNALLDIQFPHPLEHPEREHETLLKIPGVVDTGFFFRLAGRVMIGFFDGQIVVRP